MIPSKNINLTFQHMRFSLSMKYVRNQGLKGNDMNPWIGLGKMKQHSFCFNYLVRRSLLFSYLFLIMVDGKGRKKEIVIGKKYYIYVFLLPYPHFYKNDHSCCILSVTLMLWYISFNFKMSYHMSILGSLLLNLDFVDHNFLFSGIFCGVHCFIFILIHLIIGGWGYRFYVNPSSEPYNTSILPLAQSFIYHILISKKLS